MMKIDYNNKISKRCNKNHMGTLEALIIGNEDIDALLEKMHRRDKFDTDFGIEDDDFSKDDSIYLDKSDDTTQLVDKPKSNSV